MRNSLKKGAAVLLAAALCLNFAGCYSEDKTWAAKRGGTTMPIGGYIYYLYSSYSQAVSKVSTEEEVLKGTVHDEDGGEDAPAEEWILEKGLNYVKSYFYLESRSEELGVALTDEEISAASDTTDGMWSYYKTTMEDLGVAQESFNMTYSLYNSMYEKVMEAEYAEGGAMPLTEDDYRAYFTENYCNYEYFYASLTTTDDEGNSVEMTDDEKDEVEDALDDLMKEIKSGSVTVEGAASDYAERFLDSADNTTYNASSPTLTENVSDTNIKDALETMEDDEVKLVEGSTGYYVLRKLPIADSFSAVYEDEDQKTDLLYNMKSDEFADYVDEQSKSFDDLEINEKAIKSVKLKKFVTDDNKMGTSSASEETSDVSSEEESSETE